MASPEFPTGMTTGLPLTEVIATLLPPTAPSAILAAVTDWLARASVPTAPGVILAAVTERSASAPVPTAPEEIFGPVTAPVPSFAPATAPSAIFEPFTAPAFSLGAVTAPFLIFGVVTALFLICLVPTLATAQADPPRAMNRASSATAIDGDGMNRADFLIRDSIACSDLGPDLKAETTDPNPRDRPPPSCRAP